MPSAVAAAIVWALAVATNAGGVVAHHAAHHALRVWKVAAVMPSAVAAAVVWALAVATIAGGFFALFFPG
jgi:hypothetical protein